MKLRGPVGCLIKLLVLIILIMILGLVFLQFSGGSCVQRIDKTVPDATAARWEVTTPMRLYYTEGVVDDGSSVTMTGWYERLNNKWVKHTESITLERRIYGEISVKKRVLPSS